jgi:catechol 2,3-dioxygenase-like lactoylglutathione lyase family enzyme
MKLNRVVPTLWVSDIEQTISFYRNALGLSARTGWRDGHVWSTTKLS